MKNDNFIERIRPEKLKEIKIHIADDVRNDKSLSEEAKLAYGIIHLSTKTTGYDTYSQKDLAEIFELSTKRVKKIMKGLVDKRYIGYIRKGLKTDKILYVFLSTRLNP